MKQKARKIITVSMVAVTILWLIAIIVLYIGALDEAWGLLSFILLIPLFLSFLIGILAILWCVRRLLSEPRTGDDRGLSTATTIAVTVFALLTLAALVLRSGNVLGAFDETSPLGMLYADGVLTRMTLAFAALTVISACIGGIFGILIRKFRSDTKPRLPNILRTAAIALTTLLTLCVLLIPTPAGSYNDGGSRIYEAVLYDIVDWDRTQEFDGTPFHEDGQRMRIYWFPQNCYDYDMRWETGH